VIRYAPIALFIATVLLLSGTDDTHQLDAGSSQRRQLADSILTPAWSRKDFENKTIWTRMRTGLIRLAVVILLAGGIVCLYFGTGRDLLNVDGNGIVNVQAAKLWLVYSGGMMTAFSSYVLVHALVTTFYFKSDGKNVSSDDENAKLDVGLSSLLRTRRGSICLFCAIAALVMFICIFVLTAKPVGDNSYPWPAIAWCAITGIYVGIVWRNQYKQLQKRMNNQDTTGGGGGGNLDGRVADGTTTYSPEHNPHGFRSKEEWADAIVDPEIWEWGCRQGHLIGTDATHGTFDKNLGCKYMESAYSAVTELYNADKRKRLSQNVW